MATQKRDMIEDHPDIEWVRERVGGHGAGWTIYKNGLAQIDFITLVPRIKIWWYNLQLLVRHYRRR